MKNDLTHIDLFSGIGGFALAARWNGLRTIAFCERDEWCQKTLSKNFGAIMADANGYRGSGDRHEQQAGNISSQSISNSSSCPPIISDIFNFDGTQFRNAFLLTGGFPCQPFSHAGKRLGKEDDRAIWPQMARVIAEARPTWIIGENVSGLVTMELDNVLSDLERIGYTPWTTIIPACGVDARHRRDRVWIIGRRNDESMGGNSQGNSSSQIGKIQEGSNTIPGRICEDVTNTDSIGLQDSSQRCNSTCISGRGNTSAEKCEEQRDTGQFESRLGILVDGLSPGLAGFALWPEEPQNIPRVAVKVHDRVNKLKGLGNAIVPQVAFELIRMIVEIHQQS